MPPLVLPSRQPRSDYHCSGCGYGISVSQPLPLCPMCGGADWTGDFGRQQHSAAETTAAPEAQRHAPAARIRP